MRFKMDRAFYIPKGATKVADKNSDAVAYLYTTASGKLGAMTFVGKQQKPLTHYTYRDAARREEAVKEIFANRQAAMAYKAERHKERTSFVHDYKVGDLFRTSWGYEQTNVEFFEVTEVQGKYLILREIAQKRDSTGWERGNCSPKPGHFLEPRYEGDEQGKPIRRLAQKGHVRIDDVRYGWPCTATERAHWTNYY